MRFRALVLFAAIFAVVSMASCSENVESGGACPLLCPQETVPLEDTTFDAISFDTSIAGFPSLGFESNLLLAKRADTLDARIIARFDSLPTTFVSAAGEGPLTRLDSAFIRGIIPVADTGIVLGQDMTIEAYDVTDATADTSVAALGAEFTPANLLGSLALSAGMSPDTLNIQLDVFRVRQRVADQQTLRVGLRLVTASSAQLRVVSNQAGSGLTLFLFPDRDPSVAIASFPVKSLTPTDLPRLREALADFNIAVVGSTPSNGNILRVGGFPARRVLLRFNVPLRIVDSTVVVRATLIMTQRPAATAQAGDTAVVRIAPIVVSSFITDLHEMLQFAGSPQEFPLDSIVVFPTDSARREFHVVNLVRSWRGQDTVKTPRVVALYLKSETDRSLGVEFFSSEAPVGLRPQLRITYVTTVPSGRP